MTDDGVLTFELEKFSGHIGSHRWWPHVLTHHPKIDTTKIQPENSNLSDLDGETRAMVEKMMVSTRALMGTIWCHGHSKVTFPV